jgi:hypothetical protein
MVKGIYLTLLMGPTVPLPVPQVALDALTSVQVTTQDEGPAGFQLSFTLSNRSPLHTLFLLTSGQQLSQMRVIIVITLNGVPNVLMDGIVTNQQIVPGGDAGHSTLTITGKDLTTLMDQGDRDGKPYADMPIESRVSMILTDYMDRGVVPLVIPPLQLDEPVSTDRIPVQQGTDLQYLTALAKRVGYVFFVDPGPAPGTSVAYWGPKVKVSSPQPALNINMDAHTNVESLSFSFEGGERTQFILYVQDQDAKTFTKVPDPDTTLLDPPLGAIPPLNVKTQIFVASHLTMTEAAMWLLSKASESVDAVTGSGSLDVLRYGQILRARQLVGVRGAGPAFDGLHYVRSVTHNIKPGEYKQSFSLSRNGLLPTVPAVLP